MPETFHWLDLKGGHAGLTRVYADPGLEAVREEVESTLHIPDSYKPGVIKVINHTSSLIERLLESGGAVSTTGVVLAETIEEMSAISPEDYLVKTFTAAQLKNLGLVLKDEGIKPGSKIHIVKPGSSRFVAYTLQRAGGMACAFQINPADYPTFRSANNLQTVLATHTNSEYKKSNLPPFVAPDVIFSQTWVDIARGHGRSPITAPWRG